MGVIFLTDVVVNTERVDWVNLVSFSQRKRACVTICMYYENLFQLESMYVHK